MKKGSKHTPEALAKIKANNARTGKKIVFTEEHRRHMSEANKGQMPWIKGKKQTQQHIEKRVQSRFRNGTNSKITAPRREKHYLWIADRTKLSKNGENRDGWSCKISNQDCEGKIVAHHILSWSKFPELRYEINNGITLCHFHHPMKRADEIRMAPYFKTLVPNAV